MTSDHLLEHLRAGKIIDLTYPFHEQMPYWPGRLQDPFRHTVEEVRRRVWGGCFSMPEHIGTHLDAPRHFVESGRPIHELDIKDFIAEGVVIDVSDRARSDADYCMTLADLERWEKANGKIPARAVVFMNSGWGKRWKDFDAYLNRDSEAMLHFPGYSAEAARFLLHERNAVTLALDTLSADNMVMTVKEDSPVHRTVHEAGRTIIENVANLDSLPPRGMVVLVAPVPIQGGTGAPVRIFSFLG